MMCYSDFPIPAEYPNYMHNSLIMEYFRKYAEHFQLTKHIRFKVRKICPDLNIRIQKDIQNEHVILTVSLSLGILDYSASGEAEN